MSSTDQPKRYTRSENIGLPFFAACGELHKIFSPDGVHICTVTAPAYADPHTQPRMVTEQADELLRHLNRDFPPLE
jgi:hypothetical protein